MKQQLRARVAEAKDAALAVMRHNIRGPFAGLPRTAGWGYPEAYTRDMMIAALGTLATGDAMLIRALRQVLESLAKYQTPHGHIPSLAHNAHDLGASDTTPLFLMGVALYRQFTGEADFLTDAVEKGLIWMEYQSPGDEVIVAQMPTSDWRDEQWVLGFGLYVNAITFAYLRLHGQHERADSLRDTMNFIHLSGELPEGLVLPSKPHYALWAYKGLRSDRFDLLGNSLAIISGLAFQDRAQAIVQWVEDECAQMRTRGELAVALPPNFFPYIQRDDVDWMPRYENFNRPGEYHNGGVWPFICGFYIVALLAAGFPELAEEKLAALTDLVHLAKDPSLAFGFNEWVRAQDGSVQGQDWQTWSAAMYLYAAACVEQGRVLFFEDVPRA